MIKSILIYNARLVDESMDTAGAILIVDGKIRFVFQGYFTSVKTAEEMARTILKEDGIEESCSLELFNANNLTVTPAFIDMHVHLRYPGQTQKEDLSSGLKAAAAGGFGTVVAMPNTNPVVSSVEMAMQIEKEAAALGLTQLFQTVSLTKDFAGSDTSHLDFLDKKYIPVVSEDGRDVASSSVMLEAMKKASEKGVVVSCHCEDPFLTVDAKAYRQVALNSIQKVGLNTWGTPSEFDFADDRPEDFDIIDEVLCQADLLLEKAEDFMTIRNLELAKMADCKVHIAHVSSKGAIEAIRKAKSDINKFNEAHDLVSSKTTYMDFVENKEGESFERFERNYDVTCEVTPHHIALNGMEPPFNRALVNPPLKDSDTRFELIKAIQDGTVDVISTDHAPHTLEDKKNGAPGFPGVETAYAVCNSFLVKSKHISSSKLSQLMSANPARILGLNKGLLKNGYDADIVIVDSDEQWTVDAQKFYSKGRATPFQGKTLTGAVKSLIINGKVVLEK